MQNPDIFKKSMSNYSKEFKIKEIDNISYQSLYELDFINFCKNKSIVIENGPVVMSSLDFRPPI